MKKEKKTYRKMKTESKEGCKENLKNRELGEEVDFESLKGFGKENLAKSHLLQLTWEIVQEMITLYGRLTF